MSSSCRAESLARSGCPFDSLARGELPEGGAERVARSRIYVRPARRVVFGLVDRRQETVYGVARASATGQRYGAEQTIRALGRAQ